MIDISISNTRDSADSKAIKTSIKDFSSIISESAIFNRNKNKGDIQDLLITILEDLYITEPEEVINFVNQQPTKKFILNLFSQFGIDKRYTNKIPEMLRTKIAYSMSRLFEAKGSNETFYLFNDILSEFYHNLNFYNLQIEQRLLTSKYYNVFPEQVFYVTPANGILQEYDVLDQDSDNFIDPKIKFYIYTKTFSNDQVVKYHLKFYPETLPDNLPRGSEWVLPHKVKLRLNYNYRERSVIIPRGATEYTITLKKYDIDDVLTIRKKEELEYKLNNVYINDDKAILASLDPSDLRTTKYLMRPEDYFDEDIWNTETKNVFPIITNVLYIQFATSDTMDTMKFYPDLVRMFAMTYMQDNTFSFKVNDIIIKLPIQEYMNLLTFIKLKELEFSAPENPGDWKYGDHRFSPKKFSTFMFPKSRLKDIYDAIMFYHDMPHDYHIFKEFKKILYSFMSDPNQIRETDIYNITQFKEYLSGNIPTSFIVFDEMLEEFYPDDTVFYLNRDQNKIMKEKIKEIRIYYDPQTPLELFNYLAIHDKEYIGLNNSLHDMIKLHFVSKYPRVVQAIEATPSRIAFTELLLHNYKRMLAETQKMDILVTYFVNDTFRRFIFDQTFKENFFDPVLNMFQKYFFKAELSYQNTDTTLFNVKDKMQQVILGDDLNSLLGSESNSELTIRDDYMSRNFKKLSTKIKHEDKWEVSITNPNFVEETYNEQNDRIKEK